MTRDEPLAFEPATIFSLEDCRPPLPELPRLAPDPADREEPVPPEPPQPTAPGTRTFRLDDAYSRTLFARPRSALPDQPLLRFNTVMKEE